MSKEINIKCMRASRDFLKFRHTADDFSMVPIITVEGWEQGGYELAWVMCGEDVDKLIAFLQEAREHWNEEEY